MKTVTLVTTLTGLTTAMAVAAPFIVFAFLYVMRVQPERAAADRLRVELATVRNELNRRRSDVARSRDAARPRSLDEFHARTSEGDASSEFKTVLTGLLSGPEVGGVAHLSIASRTPSDGPLSPIARPFSTPVVQTPIAVTFDAHYDQIVRFFSNLRAMPTTFDLQSLEMAPLAPSSNGLVRAKVTLLSFQRAQPPVAATAESPRAQRVEDTFARRTSRDPVVTGILISSGRRVALVDDAMVSTGDRVGSSIVVSIESDAVTFASPGGARRRVGISRSGVPAPNR